MEVTQSERESMTGKPFICQPHTRVFVPQALQGCPQTSPATRGRDEVPGHHRKVGARTTCPHPFLPPCLCFPLDPCFLLMDCMLSSSFRGTAKLRKRDRAAPETPCPTHARPPSLSASPREVPFLLKNRGKIQVT